MKLREGVWFVGPRSAPVTAEGWRVVHIFIGGVIALAAVSIAIALTVNPFWLWIPIFAIGMVSLAIFFVATAKKHTDSSVNWAEYRKQNDA